MRLEIWQQFGKHTMQGLRGVAHRGKDTNVRIGLSAQKTSAPYFLLHVAIRESEKV